MELWQGRTAIPAGGPTQRAVLAMLAVRPGQPVPLDELAAGIWGESDEPLRASKGIQIHVSRLRTILKRGMRQPLTTVPGGYRLEPDGLRIDTAEFEALLAEARRELTDGDAAAAADSLRAALALWRGPALMDLRDFPFAAGLTARYDELRVDAGEERIAARLALGEAEALVPELRALVSEHPYRERLHAQLMVALYRAGQQAAALDAFTAARTRLALDLGVEPGPELVQLQRQILAQADELASPQPRAPAQQRVPHVPAPRRLPPAPELLGRGALLAELDELTARARLVTLTGAGGSGKTALALALLHRLAPRFADGAAFVDLAVLSQPEQALPAIATALGLAPSGGPLGERLAEVMAERRMLVVFDNLEHLPDAVSELVPLVEASSGLILATSRTPLRLHDEHLVEVPPLAIPEVAGEDPGTEPAVQLFLRAAAAAGGVLEGSPDELVDIARICRAVDGLPLAIEIAAAQTRVESVSELADSIAERLPLLRSMMRDRPDRQRTMETTIDWSLRRVDADAKHAFLALSVLTGSFDAAAAAAVTRVRQGTVLEQLEQLLESSLLVRQTSVGRRARFRMLEPLRAVGQAWLRHAGRLTRVAHRSATHYLAVADRLSPRLVGPLTPDALHELRADEANLSRALEHLLERDPPQAVRLVERLAPFWEWTGKEREGLQWSERLLAVDGLSRRSIAVTSLIAAGASRNLQGLHSALVHARRALELGRELADAWIVGLAELEIAMATYFVQKDPVEMTRAARGAVEAARSADDRNLSALALTSLAFAESGTARWQAADEALHLARAHGAPQVLLWVLVYRGLLEAGADQFDEAIRAYREAAEIAARFDAAVTRASAMGMMADALARSGRIDEAEALDRMSLRTLDRANSAWVFGRIEGLGEIAAARADWRRALLLLGAGEQQFRRYGGTRDAADAARLDRVLGKARETLGQARADEILQRGRYLTQREAVALALSIDANDLRR